MKIATAFFCSLYLLLYTFSMHVLVAQEERDPRALPRDRHLPRDRYDRPALHRDGEARSDQPLPGARRNSSRLHSLSGCYSG